MTVLARNRGLPMGRAVDPSLAPAGTRDTSRGGSDSAVSPAGAAVAHPQRLLLAILSLALVVFLFGVVSAARASFTHPFVGSFGPEGRLSLEKFTNVQSVATDAEGDVYVYDAEASGGSIYKFDAMGEKVPFEALASSNAITGVGGSGNGEDEIAVSPAGATKGDIYLAFFGSGEKLLVYKPNGEKASTELTSAVTAEKGAPWGRACGVAVDPSGHVYVSLADGFVDRFAPSGASVVNTDYTSALFGVADGGENCNIAVDSQESVYVDKFSEGPVLRYTASQLNTNAEPATGTPVDGKGSTLAPDPAAGSHGLYVDEQGRVSEYESNAPGPARLTGASGLTEPGLLKASFGVAANTTGGVYASSGAGLVNIYGPAEPLPPSVDGESVAELTSSAVTLRALVSPQGADTHVYFQYGSEDCAEHTCTSIPLSPGVDVGSAETDQHVSVPLAGLAPDATDHYRIVASSPIGSVSGEDQTFQTYEAPAPAGGCPNEQLRAENHSTNLPDCRVYEQVSPVEKNGGQAGAAQESARYGVASADGQAVAYADVGGTSFGEAPDGFEEHAVSRRTPDGWHTTGALPRGKVPSALANITVDFNPSRDLSHFFFSAEGPFVGAPDSVADPNAFLGSGDSSAEPQWLSRPTIADPAPALGIANSFHMGPAGGSSDFGTLFFTYDGTLVAEDAPRQANEVFQTELTENVENGEEYSKSIWGFYVSAGGALRAAGVLPDGSTSPWGAEPAATGHAGFTDFTADDSANQVSTDGARAFFVSPDPHAEGLCKASGYEGGHPGGCVPQLYVREPATGTTLLLSRTEAGAQAPHGALGVPARDECRFQCTPFVFGASDGSRAFFQSTDALTSEAPNDGLPKMYEVELARTGEPLTAAKLTYLPGVDGAAPVGGKGAVEDASAVLAAATDGSRFLFEKVQENGPVALDLWSREGGPGGTVKPVAPLPRPKGEREIQVYPARSTADASVFAFETNAPLPGGFNNGGDYTQVYRYQVSNGELACVSCPPHGITPSGDARLSEDDNQGGTDQAVGEGSLIGSRGMSANGSRIFFDTPDPLVPRDINGKRDVYEWEGGRRYLISSGTSPNESFFLDNSESGEDVFFTTTAGLAPRDTDASYDVYDARENVPQPLAGAACTGTGCQGVPPAPPRFATPASVTFTGTGNYPPQPPVKGKTAAQIRAERLTRALKSCRTKVRHVKRKKCEKEARAKYGPRSKKAVRKR